MYTESYSDSDWTIGGWHSSDLDLFLNAFYQTLDLTIPYPTLHELKMVVGVNAVRYNQGHLVRNLKPTMQSEEDLKRAFSALDSIPNPFPFNLDREAILQVFYPFSTYWYLKGKEHLEKSLNNDKYLRASHDYLANWLTQLSVEHQVPLPNMQELLLDLHNLNYFYADPLHTQSFLYDPRVQFASSIRKNYPVMYRQLFNGLTIYRKKMNQLTSDTIIDYLIHLLFTHWHNLLPKLQEKIEDNVHVLIYSVTDMHHARMIKGYLSYHFRNHVSIDLHTDKHVQREELPNLSYDIIISNRPLPDTPCTLSLCIEALPTKEDIHVIDQRMKDIRLQRLTECAC